MVAAGFARPQSRARIETIVSSSGTCPPGASPGLKAGRGLKLAQPARWRGGVGASPGLKAGRGLKQQHENVEVETELLRPASKPGAD